MKTSISELLRSRRIVPVIDALNKRCRRMPSHLLDNACIAIRHSFERWDWTSIAARQQQRRCGGRQAEITQGHSIACQVWTIISQTPVRGIEEHPDADERVPRSAIAKFQEVREQTPQKRVGAAKHPR